MAASLPERESPALRVSVPAVHPQPCLPQLLWGYCKRSGFLLCSQACLGEEAMQIKVVGVKEGKESLSWSTAAGFGDWD